MLPFVRTLVAGAIALACADAHAQIAVSGLAEVQAGRSGTDSTWTSTLFHELQADYAASGVQAGVRLEVFDAWGDRTNPAQGIEYQTVHLSQAALRLNRGPGSLTLGNTYAILGRGLTLRAFDLPGVILENQTFRRRYAPSRDLLGGSAAWQGDRLELKAVAGQPVAGDLPPGVRTGSPPQDVGRRQDWLAGGEAGVRPLSGLKLGATLVSLRPKAEDDSWAWSGYADVDVNSLLGRRYGGALYGTLYGEYARRANADAPGHGLYLSGSLGGPVLGLSLEFKDYDNFALMANDPPSLIREHSTSVLNRATHVLLAQTERGYQIEATYSLPSYDRLTVNVSAARNQLTPDRSALFREVYLEYAVDRLLPDLSATLFYDWGKDELEGIRRRHAAGTYVEWELASRQTVGVDLQALRGSRPFGDPQSFNDAYVSLSWRHPVGLGLAVSLDRTTDPLEIDDAATADVETAPLNLLSANLSARLGSRYEALLFAGRRRGGTACTSGTCYQVLPFRGLEMRISGHF